jgi:hypothetical protein
MVNIITTTGCMGMGKLWLVAHATKIVFQMCLWNTHPHPQLHCKADMYEHVFVVFTVCVQNSTICAKMQFSLKLGKAATEMHEMPVTTNGSDDVTNKTVFNWFQKFRHGRTCSFSICTLVLST